jgi:hypothetical protein
MESFDMATKQRQEELEIMRVRLTQVDACHMMRHVLIASASMGYQQLKNDESRASQMAYT